MNVTLEPRESLGPFLRGLRQRRRRQQAGLLFALVLRVAGMALFIILALAMADFLLALPAVARTWAGTTCVVFLLLLTARLAWPVIRLTDADTAERIDEEQGDQRRSVLSALDLSGTGQDEPATSAGLLAYLTGESVRKGAAVLECSPLSRAWPSRRLRRRLRVLLVQTAAFVSAVGLAWPIARVVLPRVVLPLRDIPPYTHYQFAVSPEPVTVIYGGSVEIAVSVTGRPVDAQVFLATRYAEREHAAACFQEGENRYAQRLEGVVAPISYCFRLGRARTKWRKVTVLLKPEITAARLFVTPPAYTGLGRREVPLTGEDVRAVKGSQAELRLTSNRPLADGALVLRTGEEADPIAEYAGNAIGTHTVTFTLPLETTSRASVTVRDARGTENDEPFVLHLTALADAPPSVNLSDPPSFALATPDAIIALKGSMEDDFGLRRADLARGVRGYRDRFLPLTQAPGQRRVDIDKPVDLGMLGVLPGDVLEFYLEARDFNPDLTGVAASGIARVKIISPAQYAESLRMRTTTEELVERYRAAAATMENALEQLRKLQEMSQRKDTDGAALQEQKGRATKALRAAEELHRTLANDVAVFDLEKDLAKTLRSTFADLHHSRRLLERSDGASPQEVSALAEELLAKLAKGREALAEQEQRAEAVASVGRVMECVGIYQTIVRRQTDLVRKLSGMSHQQALIDPDFLRSIAHVQRAIREDLLTFVSELQERASVLPDGFEEFRESASTFADAISKLEIPSVMHEAVVTAENRNLGSTRHHAEIALERLKMLLDDCQGQAFGGLSQGKLKFKVPMGMELTLQQMLDAMGGNGRMGLGLGGSGVGRTGRDGGGYALNAYSPMNVPLYGRQRHSLTRQQRSGRAGSDTECPAGAVSALPSPEADRLGTVVDQAVGSSALPRQAVPPKYEGAVRRYFSEDSGE